MFPGEVPVLRRRANLVVRWGLAGILAAASLFGSKLHDICGICHAGQQGGCEGRAIVSSVAAGHSATCDDGANCPICNYLAQGRVVGERFEGLAATVNVPNRSPAVPLVLAGPHLQLFQAQAPPAA